jgi:hypothetical protein
MTSSARRRSTDGVPSGFPGDEPSVWTSALAACSDGRSAVGEGLETEGADVVVDCRAVSATGSWSSDAEVRCLTAGSFATGAGSLTVAATFWCLAEGLTTMGVEVPDWGAVRTWAVACDSTAAAGVGEGGGAASGAGEGRWATDEAVVSAAVFDSCGDGDELQAASAATRGRRMRRLRNVENRRPMEEKAFPLTH